MNRLTHWCVGALALVFAAAGGAQQFVYPAKGQSPQQQQKHHRHQRHPRSQSPPPDPDPSIVRYLARYFTGVLAALV